MYLEVNTLAELVTADGKSFTTKAWNGEKSDRGTPFDWPRSYRPGTQAWEIWRSALKLFTPPHSSQRTLSVPLGPWYNRWDSTWQWWLSPSNLRIYQQQPEGSWKVWVPNNRHYRRSEELACPLPPDLQRADVWIAPNGNHLILETIGHSSEQHPMHDPPAHNGTSNVYSIIEQLNEDL